MTGGTEIFSLSEILLSLLLGPGEYDIDMVTAAIPKQHGAVIVHLGDKQTATDSSGLARPRLLIDHSRGSPGIFMMTNLAVGLKSR